MSDKSTFVDYEALSRPRGRKGVESEPFDEGVTRSKAKAPDESPLDRFSEPLVEPIQGKPANGLAAVDSPASENWIFKHGHTVSYVGLFLFTFFVYFRPYEFFPSLTWLSNAAFWVAIFTLSVFVPTQLALENSISIKPREVKLAAVLVLLSLISILVALDKLRAWNSFVDYLKVVLMFVVTVNVVRTEKRLKRLWLLVLIVTCVLSVGAINDYRLGNLALKGVRIKGVIGGLFENPNDMALHLVTMAPIAAALAITSRGPLRKSMYLVIVVVITAGVVATFSRGGFLGFACATGVFLWRVFQRSRFLIGLSCALAIAVFVILAPGAYGDRLATTGDDSSRARFDDLKRSVYVAVHHPVLGVGIDNYVLYSNSNHATHNAYTQVAAEAGFPAMVCYIMLLIAPITQLRKIIKQTYSGSYGRWHYLAIGLEASLVGYMVSSFFASVAFLWYSYYLVAYSICLRRIYAEAQNKAGLQGKEQGVPLAMAIKSW